MLRPPPISTLFPYTTLFRSGDRCVSRPGPPIRVHEEGSTVGNAVPGGWPTHSSVGTRSGNRATARRSEEYTSELQSPDHLVCRLLLEKKKIKKIIKQIHERT